MATRGDRRRARGRGDGQEPDAEPVGALAPTETLTESLTNGEANEPSGTAMAHAGTDNRKTLIFFICAMALFMTSINGSIVASALPRIGKSLGSPINWTGWTITIYQLGQVIAAPISGRVSDQFGRKKVFLVCITIFTLSSLSCGLATSIYMLLPLRFLQALGGGAFIASTSGIVSDHFGSDRDRAIGMFTSITPVGFILGPVFGGLIAQHWSWRGIFFVNVPVGVLVLALAIHFVPRAAPTVTSAFDVKGVLLLPCVIVTGMLAITMLGEPGVTLASPRVLVPFACALLLGRVFLRHSRRTAAPFIPLQLLFGKGFAVMNVLNFVYGTAALGFTTVVPLYAEDRYHISVTNAGTVLSARGLGTICIAAAAALMIRKTGYRLPMLVGFLSMAFSLVMLSIAPRILSPYWWLALFALFTGLGIGIAAPATNNATLQRAPEQVAGMVGLRQMFRQSGGIFYISIATAVLARSAHPGLTQAHLFLIQALVLVLTTTLVFTVPDHKGSW